MSGEPRAAVASVVLVQEAVQRAGAREVVVDQQLVAAPAVVEGPEWHEVVVARTGDAAHDGAQEAARGQARRERWRGAVLQRSWRVSGAVAHPQRKKQEPRNVGTCRRPGNIETQELRGTAMVRTARREEGDAVHGVDGKRDRMLN